MRTYERTHPWLKFSVNLSQAPPDLWVMLGECQSKCEHISNTPILPQVQADLLQIYLAKGSLATAAIEGNTLSEEEVIQHLEGKLRLPPSKKYLGVEIDNIVNACNTVLDFIRAGRQAPPLIAKEIETINKLMSANLEMDDEVVPGEIRTHSVGVPGYRGAPAEDCEYLLERLCQWLAGPVFDPPENMGVVYAIIKAILAHLYLAWIHPFGDGNGRTARLVELRILMSSGVPHPAAHLLSNHYNQTRSEYYRQLRRASASGGDVLPFMRYAVQGFLDGLRGQLMMIHDQQWLVVWRDLVWGKFGGKGTHAQIRRRRLVFALSRQAAPVPISELPELDPKLMLAYAGKTRKAIARDVNALIDLGLVSKDKSGVRVRTEALLGFQAVKTLDNL